MECEATVSHGTQIHCVECVSGVNFSASFGFEKCQPCGLCVGKHQKVLSECAPDRNITCECQDGYYFNETARECIPCVSCCSEEGKIQEECLNDGGKIRRKCKLKGQKPQICKSFLTTTPSHPFSKRLLTSLEVLNLTTNKSQENIYMYKHHTPKTKHGGNDRLWLFAGIALVVFYLVVTILYFRWRRVEAYQLLIYDY